MTFSKDFIPHNKGKTWEESYGIEKAKILKEKRQDKTYEEIHGVEKANEIKNKLIFAHESGAHDKGYKQQAETMRRRYASGEIKVWNTGHTKETDERLKKVSEKNSISHKGQHSSPETEWKTGHISWNKGKKTGIVPKSAFRKGHIPFNKDKKMSDLIPNYEAYNKNKKMAELIPNYVHPMQGKIGVYHQTEEAKKQKSKTMKEWYRTHESPIKGRENKWGHHSEETKQKLRIAEEQLWQDEEYRESQLTAIFNGMKIKPTVPEKQLLQIINNNNFPFIYVGNGKFWINGRNPDFICNNGAKLIIEMFGTYWHNKVGAKEYDEERLKIYEKYGYTTLIIWEHELKKPENVVEKIKNFITVLRENPHPLGVG